MPGSKSNDLEEKPPNSSLHREDHFRLLMDSAKDYAIFTLDPERRIVSWSTGATLILGYAEAEIVGQTGDIIFVPEDRDAKVPQKEAETARKNGRAENERWHLRKDGSRFWGSGVTNPLYDEEGNFIGFVKIMRDLTETRDLENTKLFLASIVETSNDSIVTIDLQRNITSWNKAAEHLYGYTAKDAIGKNLDMLTLPGDLVDLIRKVDAVKHSRELAVFHTVRQNKKGELKHLEIVMSPVLNSSDEVIGISTIARDISERKRHEANLAFLAKINFDIAPLSKVQDVIAHAAKQLADYLQLSRFHFSLIDKSHDRLQVIYEYRKDDNLPSILGAHVLSENLTEEGIRHLSNGKLTVIANTADNNSMIKASRHTLKQLGFHSLIEVPHVVGDQWRYLLTVGRTDIKEWRSDELEIIQQLASKIFLRIERAEAEEMLSSSEDQMRRLANVVPQIIWTNNVEGKADYFNQRWYEYTGLSFEQSEGPGWQAVVHPDDAPASVEKWRKALAAGEIFDTEYRLRRSDGIYRWFIGRNVPLRNDGKVSGWFGTATDIDNLKKTEEALRQSEEKLRITLETATDYAIIAMDSERKVERWSQGATQLFGYTEAEMLGRTADIIFTEEDREAGAQQKEMEIARDNGRAPDERWHQAKDGKRFYVNGVLRPIKNSVVTGYVKVMRDVTSQQLFTEELHRQVQEQTRDLQRSNEDLLQFAHVTSHDLQEPVRKIKTFNNLVIKQYASEMPEKAKFYLEKTSQSVNRLGNMIQSILNYSRIGRSESIHGTVDLNKILEEIILDLELYIAEKKATISRPTFPAFKGNGTLLHQLFYNLLANSLKFSKENIPLQIVIDYRYITLRDNRFIEITLQDNGIGFENEYNASIFEIFSRLHPKDKYEGTGLGLALCKKIVDRHHGHIYASGRPGEGAVFTIQLPV